MRAHEPEGAMPQDETEHHAHHTNRRAARRQQTPASPNEANHGRYAPLRGMPEHRDATPAATKSALSGRNGSPPMKRRQPPPPQG